MATLTIEQLQAQLAELTARLAALEKHPPEPESEHQAQPTPVMDPEISEEELIAISAAVAAFLGVRPHIRQIRLAGGNAWAQQGRVSIQASHMLQS